MAANHIAVGLLLLLAALVFFAVKFFRAPGRGPFRAWGWAGLAIIGLSESLLFLRVELVGMYFTPLVWTGYILLVDALVGRLAGESRLAKSPQEFFWLAFWSFPFWLIFEAYNLHLANWSYIGLPRSLAMRGVGYVWSYATIWPAMYETADLVRALGICAGPAKRRLRFSSSSHARMVFAGLLLVTFPLLLPAHVSQYLFGAIWLGFIFLLDPINYRWNGRSFLRDWETGDTSTFWSFLVAGIVCGILWEFWNFWAQAKWLYVFPIGPSAKIFEMPLAGYLGFPAFALECFAMYEFLKSSRNRLEAFQRATKLKDMVAGPDRRFRPQSES